MIKVREFGEKLKWYYFPAGNMMKKKYYMLLKQGLDFLGGVETLIPKDAKILLKPNLLKKDRGRESSDHTSGCSRSFCGNPA
mgnify:CR=1 FL=1